MLIFGGDEYVYIIGCNSNCSMEMNIIMKDEYNNSESNTLLI